MHPRLAILFFSAAGLVHHPSPLTLQTNSQLPHFYKTSNEIESGFRKLITKCPQFTVSAGPYPLGQMDERGHRLFVSRLTSVNNASPPFRVFLLSNEHARELITAELSLRVAETLCRLKQPPPFPLDVVFVPIANPISRLAVEENGEFCLRTDENGVDLNRNWGGIGETFTPETYGGVRPLSEWETRQLAQMLEGYPPDLFISIHSGSRLIAVPPASRDLKPSPGSLEQAKLDLLAHEAKNLVKEFVKGADSGSMIKAIGYDSPGSCIDFVWTKIRPSGGAFAFEIYQGSVKEVDVSDTSVLSLIRNEESLDFAARWKCFVEFNPSEETQKEAVLEQWTQVTLRLIRDVHLMQK